MYRTKVHTRDELLDLIMDVITHIKERQDALRRATRHVLTRVAKCIDADGGIFEKVFLLNNQPDPLIILIYSVIKLYIFRTWNFQAESGRNYHPDCLEAVIRNLHETYQCRMSSRKLLMMDRENSQNM